MVAHAGLLLPQQQTVISLTPPTPKTASLVDPFDSDRTDLWGAQSAATINNGGLLWTVTTAYPYKDSLARYDLIGSSFTLEVNPTVRESLYPTYADTELIFQLLDPGNNGVSFLLAAGDWAVGQSVSNGNSTDLQGANVSGARFFRISEAGGTLTWVTSPDGVAWTSVATWVPPFALTSLSIRLMAGHYDSAVANPPGVRFESVNVIPGTSTPITVTPNAAGQAPTAAAPTVTPGRVTVTPNVAGQTPAPIAPAVTTPITVTPDLAGGASTSSAPTVTMGAVTVTPTVAGQAPTTAAPTVTPGPITATPGVAGQAPTAAPPTVTGGPITVAPDVVGQAAIPLEPMVALGAGLIIPSGPAGSAPTATPPTVTGGVITVTPDVVGQSPTAAPPTVTGSIKIYPPLLTDSGGLYPPAVRLGPLLVSPDTVGQSAVALAPRLKGDERVFAYDDGQWDPRQPKKWNGQAWVVAPVHVVG